MGNRVAHSALTMIVTAVAQAYDSQLMGLGFELRVSEVHWAWGVAFGPLGS